ncbi:unnamed protein product [Bursaphelenchus xylophilus]|nr:unnamed protein product [Bursaphelenchus xylophilus]CAG9108819.1 unnamed protein product [Bursaphelenchus xylophilus]
MDSTRHPLHLAVILGNLDRVKSLVNQKVCDVDEEDERGQIALQLAVLSSNSEITQFLIDSGACVDHSDFTQITASHLVAKYNKVDQFNILLKEGADFTLKDKCGKSGFDIACEYGRVAMVLRLIENGVLKSILDRIGKNNQEQTSGLHLAARNGHVEICHHLIEKGFPINLQTQRGSALHEAVEQRHLDIVILLLHRNIDLSIRNRDGLTVLNLYEDLKGYRNSFNVDLSLLLRTHPHRTYAQALIDYQDPLNPVALSLYQHQLIWIIDHSSPVFWKGIVFEEFGYSRSGVFPPEIVCIIDNKQGEMRNPDSSSGHGTASRMTVRRVKRIEAPVVPDLPGMADFNRRSRNFSDGSRKLSNTMGSMFPDLLHSCHSSSSPSSSRAASSCADPSDLASLDAGTLSRCEMNANKSSVLSTFQPNSNYLPERVTSGRNSTGSTSSSQNSSGFESGKYENVASSHSTSSFASNPNDSPSRRCFSVNRQSSSADVYGTLEETYTIDVNEMLAKGISDSEILGEWLEKLGLQQYLSSFILQGFDVSSVSKLIAEDLLALGVTDPRHRKIIHADIQNWNVVDGWPRSVSPTSQSSVWLKAIGLPQYVRLFEIEGYDCMKKVEDLTFEDLEDMGIKKLGHIKRICLALKKLKMCRRKQEQHEYINIAESAIPQHPLNPSVHSSQNFLKNDEWRPKLQIIKTQQILSATPELPRSINGEIMKVGMDPSSLFGHQDFPSSPSDPYSTLPPLPLTARGPLKMKSQDLTRPSTAHLARSSTFCSAPNASNLY